MFHLLSFCDCSPWLLWIAPFLLGLMLGWFIWGVYRKYRAMYESALKENKSYKKEISSLENTVFENKKSLSSVEGDLALSNGRINELAFANNELKNEIDKSRLSQSENETFQKDTFKPRVEVSQEQQSTKDANLEKQIENIDSEEKSASESDGISQGGKGLVAGTLGYMGVSRMDGDQSQEDSVDNTDDTFDKSISDAKEDNNIADGKGDIDKHAAAKIGDSKNDEAGPARSDNTSAQDGEAGEVGSGNENAAKEESTQEGDGLKPESSTTTEDKFAKLAPDNLQIIEGIGPKMESICKDNGIADWTILASQTTDDLNAMLKKYGDRYRIIDPEPWPLQAILARDRNWNELIQYQKSVGGARISDSKLEKMMIKLGIIKQWKDNDLKAIEGIGPKIEDLLKKNRITTWKLLSETTLEQLNAILEAAGPRYKLADPSTWPSQAKLAAEGKFDELEDFQSTI